MTSSLFLFHRKYDAQLRLNSINEHSFSFLFKLPISVTFFKQRSEREIHDFSFSFINCNSYSLSLSPAPSLSSVLMFHFHNLQSHFVPSSRDLLAQIFWNTNGRRREHFSFLLLTTRGDLKWRNNNFRKFAAG